MSAREELAAYFDDVDAEVKRLDAHFTRHPIPPQSVVGGIDRGAFWKRAWHEFVWHKPYILTNQAAVGWMDFSASRNPRNNLHIWVNGDDLAQVQVFEQAEIRFYRRYLELGGVPGPEPKAGYVSPVDDEVTWPQVALTVTFAATLLVGATMAFRR